MTKIGGAVPGRARVVQDSDARALEATIHGLPWQALHDHADSQVRKHYRRNGFTETTNASSPTPTGVVEPPVAATQPAIFTHPRRTRSRARSLTGKHLFPHLFRHTWAMNMRIAGHDVSIIALWLGHQDVSSTMKYLHADLKLKEKALDRTAAAEQQQGRRLGHRIPTRMRRCGSRSPLIRVRLSGLMIASSAMPVGFGSTMMRHGVPGLLTRR